VNESRGDKVEIMTTKMIHDSYSKGYNVNSKWFKIPQSKKELMDCENNQLIIYNKLLKKVAKAVKDELSLREL
jgi:hypothetical protein